MKDKKSASLFQKEQVMESLKQSFVKLDPRVMIKNPIMFTVELVTLVMLVVCILSLGTTEYGTFGYNFLVFVVLFVTLLFANFAEAIAEARGKAQADSLRKTREETPAKILIDGKVCNHGVFCWLFRPEPYPPSLGNSLSKFSEQQVNDEHQKVVSEMFHIP